MHSQFIGVCALLASVTLGLALVNAPAQAASLVGKPCKKAGATTGDGPGRTLVCTKITRARTRASSSGS
ncbi:MAG: hypothetical protein VW082_01355 [Candidatus Nanopelagicales bacterium]|jgi:hypothetical protein